MIHVFHAQELCQHNWRWSQPMHAKHMYVIPRNWDNKRELPPFPSLPGITGIAFYPYLPPKKSDINNRECLTRKSILVDKNTQCTVKNHLEENFFGLGWRRNCPTKLHLVETIWAVKNRFSGRDSHDALTMISLYKWVMWLQSHHMSVSWDYDPCLADWRLHFKARNHVI